MRLATLFVVLGIPAVLHGQKSDQHEYRMDVLHVNTEHAVKVTGIVYVGTAKYRVQTECVSTKDDYPCVVPRLGTNSVSWLEGGKQGMIAYAKQNQAMGMVVDIEVVK